MSTTCASCQHYHPVYHGAGKCRRFPPVPISASTPPEWPVVEDSDWCGEWRDRLADTPAPEPHA